MAPPLRMPSGTATAMDSPTPTTKGSATLWSYLRCFAGFAGRRLWFTLALVVATSLLAGSGLLALLPLMQMAGLGRTGTTPHGTIATFATGMRLCGLPFTLPTVLGLLVLLIVSYAILRAWMVLYQKHLETDFSSYLHERFYAAMVRAEWRFFLRQRTSDISQIMFGEMQAISSGTRQLLMIFGIVGVGVIDVLVAWTIAPMLTAGMFILGGLAMWALRPTLRRMFGLGQGQQHERAALATNVSEFLGGLKVAKSHGKETEHYERYCQIVRRLAGQMVAAAGYHAKRRAIVEISTVLALSGVLYVALRVLFIPLAEILLLGYVFLRLFGRANTLYQTAQGVLHALPAFAAMEQQRQAFLAAAETTTPSLPKRLFLQQGLRLEQVTFRYASEAAPPALANLTLDLPAHQITAICGPSGAGKSTLADLLLGLMPPTSGCILLDGAPLTGSRLHDWRQSIGYVPQETFLFHDTIRANLLWAAPTATEAELRGALRAAAAETFVDRLPQGLDTMLGDRGVRLSGGERQRIALSRALLRRPALLVLDEATSALDTHNERLIQEAIGRLHGEVTIVVIAHRLSTVRQADRIAVLQQGRLAECGSWHELMAQPQGVFHSLVSAQAESAELN